MPRALVIGSPIAHSLSPVLHTAGYRALGLSDWSYERHDVGANDVPAFVAALPDDVVGVSVTMPDKEPALALADASSGLAREVGAANTLVRRADGWFADNTDVAGVLHALLDAGCSEASSAVVLGSGATARSVVAAIAQLGVREVTFVVRQEARPETVALAETYDMQVQVLREGAPDVVASMGLTPLLISTAPAHGADALADVLADAPALRLGAVGGPHVFDVVYADWPTKLARVASDRGATVVSGLDMLVHQAAVQFEFFTGRSAPISDMKAAGLAAVEG